MTESKNNKVPFNTIDEAVQDIRDGKLIIVVDDEDRENEGDFICSAQLTSPEIVNFMATNGRGLSAFLFPKKGVKSWSWS